MGTSRDTRIIRPGLVRPGTTRPVAAGVIGRRRLLQMGAAAAGVVSIPLLGACSGGENTAGDEGGGDERASARPDRSAILKWGTMRSESMDPIRQVGVENVQLNAVFDTLLTISPRDGTIGPRLVREWDGDDERLRLTLRDDVVFQDETPFDAEAVKFNLDRVRRDPDSNIAAMVAQLDSVEVVDDYVVDLNLSEPTPLALLLALTDRPGMMASPTAVREAGDSASFSEQPVGSGMYRIDGEWRPRESMSVRAWDGYWDTDAALLGGVDFTDVDLNAKVNAIRSGSIDICSVEGFDVPALEDDDAVRLRTGPGPRGRGLTVNTTIEPLDDVRVRRAIACAIDRDAVVEAMTAGHGEARYQVFASDSPAYDESLDELHQYDPDRARELLEDAGHRDGVTFQSVVGGTAAAYVQFGELLQAQLERVGITMDLELVDQSRTLPLLYREGGTGTAASAPIGGGANAADTDRWIRDWFLEGGGFNAGDVEVPGVRELLRDAGSQPDTEAARRYYQEINALVTEDLYQIIPVYADAAITVRQPYVGGLTRAILDVDGSPELLRGLYITEGQEEAPDE